MFNSTNTPLTADMDQGEDRHKSPKPRCGSEETPREVDDATSEQCDKPINEDDNIYYDSDVDYYPSSPPPSSSSSSSSSPSSSLSSSPDLPKPLFPTPLPSISQIYPRWTHITTLQTHYIAQYNTAHAHLGVQNLQLASLDSTKSPCHRRRRRRLLQSSRKANLKILLHAMLHVARLTGEKIKLQQQSMHTPSFPPKPQTPQNPTNPPAPHKKQPKPTSANTSASSGGSTSRAKEQQWCTA